MSCAAAGANDLALLERTKVGRDINRHYYSRDEVVRNLDRPVVKRLFNLMRFRNTYPAFDGACRVQQGPADADLRVEWHNGNYMATLSGNLQTRAYSITYRDPTLGRVLDLPEA